MSEVITESARAMYADDLASQSLGIRLVAAESGRAVVSMTVRPDQCNGLGVCHGGLIFTLADTAMAFATNADGDRAFATNAEVDFVNAARAGDELTAECVRIVSRGRAGVSDVTVRKTDGEIVAVFRGRTLATRD
ncbi:MAG: hotdog fold thioesterase [Ilumatobacteraceae bacterium]